MFDYKHYVPIVRWKAGERTALRELYDDDKAGLTPLIEIPSGNIETFLKKLSLTEFTSQLRMQILECWGRRLAFLDLYQLMLRITLNERGAFAEHFYAQPRRIGLILVPVSGISWDSVPWANGRRGISVNEVCLRLLPKDVQSPSLTKDINTWLANTEIDNSKVHLILDLQTVGADELSYLKPYKNIPFLNEWRTITIVGGSFPKDLQDLSVGEHLLPRLEWYHWKQLLRTRQPRVPTFGDYTTLHAFLQPSFPGMNVSASIRYTTDDHWLVMRGEGLLNEDGDGHAQYPANAQLLMQRPEFRGSDFSFGDNYIYERPKNRDKPGTPRSWVTAGVNHHLTFVVRQIANLFELPIQPRRYTQVDMGFQFVAEASENASKLNRGRPKQPPKG